MNKQQYEANPKSYWEVPEMVGKPLNPNMCPIEDCQLWLKYVLPEIKINKNHNLCVDMGSGAGRYIGHTAKYFNKVMGVDFSVHSIYHCGLMLDHEGIKNVELYHTSLAQIPNIQNNSVDFAYSCAVFMHMPNNIKTQALKELQRILHPEGKAVLMECSPLINAAFDCPDITDEKWKEMISDAGLEIIGFKQAIPFVHYKQIIIKK